MPQPSGHQYLKARQRLEAHGSQKVTMSACAPERNDKIAVNPAQKRLIAYFLRNGFFSTAMIKYPPLHMSALHCLIKRNEHSLPAEADDCVQQDATTEDNEVQALQQIKPKAKVA